MQKKRLGFLINAVPAFLLLSLAVSLGTIGCGDDDDEEVGGDRFDPADVSINVGDTVKWVGTSGTHTVTSGTGSNDPDVGDLFDEELAQGGSFSFVFLTPGEYDYFCRHHEAENMRGTVTVSAPTPKRVNVSATSANTFSPDSVMINVGDTVHWTSSGAHTVTSGTGPNDPNSGDLFDRTGFNSGHTFDFVFAVAGVVNYYCDPHFGTGMTGKVVVVAPTPKTVEVEALD